MTREIDMFYLLIEHILAYCDGNPQNNSTRCELSRDGEAASIKEYTYLHKLTRVLQHIQQTEGS